jgi:hypothetical protein
MESITPTAFPEDSEDDEIPSTSRSSTGASPATAIDNPSVEHSSFDKKRKLDSWIYEHGTVERVGKKKYWLCNYCTYTSFFVVNNKI